MWVVKSEMKVDGNILNIIEKIPAGAKSIGQNDEVSSEYMRQEPALATATSETWREEIRVE